MTGALKIKQLDGSWVVIPSSGASGGGGDTVDVAYRHYQSTASTTWTILHSLTFRPNVTVVDSTGREVWPGNVDYVNDTTIQLTFSAAFGGEAYLS